MLKIFNTLTGKKEILKPLRDNHLGIYVCGPTVYDYCHIGNGRTFTGFDVIVRYLRFKGYKVTYVRNITDIDDKIIKRAQETNQSFHAVVEFFTQAMREDLAALNLLPPNHEPRATEFIPQMQNLIQQLIQRDLAYVGANGDVYYRVRAFKDYGCLSHHLIEQLESGARVEISEAKEDPLDFVLWKLAKPDEPAWDSPWGSGRPGWHIECSAMSMQILGESFDLHGGGRDLTFPHHENEIAQSVGATQQPFANIWMHCGFLQMDKEKMSKSLGNFFTIHDLLQSHSKEALRFFLINAHYRSPLAYTRDAILQSQLALDRLYTALLDLPSALVLADSSYERDFVAAMDDDFNVPIALSVLFEIAHEIQRLREQDLDQAARLGALLKYLGGVLGCLETHPEVYFQQGAEVDNEKITLLIAARQQARTEKNWLRADQIRDELAALSVIIEDSAEGTRWKYKR